MLVSTIGAVQVCASRPSEVPDTAEASALLRSAKAQQNNGALDSALSLSERTERLCREGLISAKGPARRSWSMLLLTAQRNRGSQLFFQNRYPESIEAIKAYLATAEELQLSEEIGAAYNYLGYCYTAMEDLPTALAWSRKAMVVLRDIGGGIDLANAYTGMGNILDEMAQYDSALVYMRKALTLHRTLEQAGNHAATLFSTIEILRHLHWSDSVDVHLARARVLVEQLDEPRSMMNYMNLLGQRRVEQGRSVEAIAHLLQADSLALLLEDHRSRHYINRALGLAYAAVGDARSGVERSELADAELKEDMGLEKIRAVSATQAKAEQEKALAKATADAEAFRQGRWLAWSVAAGGAVIALLLGMLYRQSRNNAHELFASNQVLVETQDELMRVGKEREAAVVRTRVARDIHDELGGSLSKIALLGDLLQGAGASTEEHAQRLRSIADHARQVRGALNDVVWAADPTSDSAGALLQHIADRAHHLLDGTGVELKLDLRAKNPDLLLGPAFKRDLSMVVKEALNNALKHGHPDVVRIRLHLENDRFELVVQDDGQGMGQSPTEGGNGLANMRERMVSHNGVLKVCAVVGGPGTVVNAHGPLA